MKINPYLYDIRIKKEVIEGIPYHVATVSQLPDLTEYGDTWREAYELAIDTIRTAADMYADAGRAFPPPMKITTPGLGSKIQIGEA